MTEPTTAVQYEVRHAELRKLGSVANTGREGDSVNIALWAFEERTGESVDQVLAWAREVSQAIASGEHQSLPGSPGEDRFASRSRALTAALAKLDESASRA